MAEERKKYKKLCSRGVPSPFIGHISPTRTRLDKKKDYYSLFTEHMYSDKFICISPSTGYVRPVSQRACRWHNYKLNSAQYNTDTPTIHRSVWIQRRSVPVSSSCHNNNNNNGNNNDNNADAIRCLWAVTNLAKNCALSWRDDDNDGRPCRTRGRKTRRTICLTCLPKIMAQEFWDSKKRLENGKKSTKRSRASNWNAVKII